MRIKLDENVSARAKEVFLERGHDCETVWDEKMSGAPDERLIEVCVEEKRHLITQDLDFADIITYPPAKFHGIVVFRLTRQDTPAFQRRLRAVLPKIESLDLPGHLLIVGDSRIRYR